MDSAIVRQLLLNVWGHQACQVRPQDWPDVLARLLKAGVCRESGSTRYPMKIAVEEAVVRIEALLRLPELPHEDLAHAIWRAFPRFDREHAAMLADHLVAQQRVEGMAA
jgi:hypothetical protein